MTYLVAVHVDGNLHIEQVSAHPGSARSGTGRLLIDHMAQHARTTGISALTLTTFTEPPWNAPFHARLGFQHLAENELTPGLRDIREHEAARGLGRWPRTRMRRAV